MIHPSRDVGGDATRVSLVGRPVAAAAAGVADDRLAGLEADVRVRAELVRECAVDARFALRGAAAGQAAADAARRVVGAVAEVDDVELAAVDRAELDVGAGRAAVPAGALAVGDDPLLVDDDRVLHLVDLDAVAEAGSRLRRCPRIVSHPSALGVRRRRR